MGKTLNIRQNRRTICLDRPCVVG